MSLNGLDDPTVIESYQTALAEAGGWFLLKYASRDTVALLSRGTGGVTEIRITIDGYEEKSPLYGFLQYRRRKIILKYVPEGISRLLQARLTVQFQSILDKFTPNDTIFALSESSELTESALSSACLLHAASGSMTSSTSSLRRRKLGEITEDAEENAGGKDYYVPPDSGDRNNRRESMYSRTSEATAVPTQRDGDADSIKRSMSQFSSDAPEKTPEKPLPAIPQSRDRQGSRSNGVQPKPSLDYAGAEPRPSTQSTRASIRDMDQMSWHKPKVKLGPRPSMDPSGRPRTAGSMGKRSDSSLVASLPAGVRSSARKSAAPRPKSHTDLKAPSLPPSNVPPVPALLVPPPTINLGPVSRNGGSSPRSIMSVPASMGVSPEKQRLMRALQLRKQQMAKRTDETEKQKKEVRDNNGESTVPKLSEDEQPSQSAPEESEEKENVAAPTVDDQPLDRGETRVETPQDEPEVSKDTSNEENHTPPSSSTPDSAVDMADMTDSSSVEDDPETLTADDSKPSTNGDLPVSETSLLCSDSVVSDNKSNTKPDDEQSSLPAEFNPAGRPKDKEGVSQNSPTEVAPDSGQSQLKLTEIETHDEFSDSETPTPRAIPFKMSYGEVKTEPLEQPAVQTEADATEPKEPEEIPEPQEQSAVQIEAEATEPKEREEIPEPQEQPAVQAEVETTEPEKPEDIPEPQNQLAVQAEAEPTEPKEPEEIPEPHPVSSPQASQEPAEPNGTSAPVVETDVEAPAAVNNHNKTSLNHKDSLKNRRRGVLDPINIPTNVEFSDEDNLLSDDSFMEELKSASVQEAKPITLPKTGSNDDLGSPAGHWTSSRVVSTPTGGEFSDVQALPVGRSSSGPAPAMVPRKVNVSSGISKRIKALELFSGNEPGPNQQAAAPTPPPPAAPASRSSSQLDKFRKRTSMSKTRTAPASDLGQKPPPEPESTTQKPPVRRESVPDNSRRSKSASVSVTAKIIRDQSAPLESASGPSEPPVINLQPSELTVEHGNQDEGRRTSVPTITGTDKHRLSTSSSSPRSPPGSTTGNLPRSDSRTSRLSISSISRYERTLSQSSSEQNVEEGKDERKGSRKSRIIRRMSSMTSNSRRGLKNALSPTVKEEEPQVQKSPAESSLDDHSPEPPQVVDLGEVNVQFPDTLLWKRRFMRIDDQGYLILTPNTSEGTVRNIVKRYHFSEFRAPCLPDHDRQELPNSIILDFLDGSTLQCACESRQGQNAVLRTLMDAHRTYRSDNTR